jgi:predicted nucleic acid-binding protein
MKRLLIDTDVILDFFFDRQPFSDDAAILLSYCENKQIHGFITPVIISNIYYLLKRTASHDKVVEKLEQLLTIIDILSMDGRIVRLALKSGFRDFEDALQNFSAVSDGNIDVIVTRNIKDYVQSEMSVMTPEDFIITFGLT